MTPSARTARVLGYVAYIGVMSAGYYYNLTFVQLGIIDLGERRVGMDSAQVSFVMAALALSALTAALATGRWMDRRGWSADLRVKLRVLFGVIGVQTVLTMAAPSVAAPGVYVAWVMACSIAIGVGIPVTFSLMADFIAVPHRGHVAAVVAGLSFAAAAIYPLEWRIETFAPVMVTAMVPAVIVLGVVSFRRLAVIDILAAQHRPLP